jgi:hypothetical protein
LLVINFFIFFIFKNLVKPVVVEKETLLEVQELILERNEFKFLFQDRTEIVKNVEKVCVK